MAPRQRRKAGSRHAAFDPLPLAHPPAHASRHPRACPEDLPRVVMKVRSEGRP
ncbi:hypothetical protein ACFOHY_20950 [Rhizobium rosettiformans]|uniref:hypothetical protein n=1 Tax=Rhizobium rosettiformans TaxID=1368430 RepID=UPI0036099697